MHRQRAQAPSVESPIESPAPAPPVVVQPAGNSFAQEGVSGVVAEEGGLLDGLGEGMGVASGAQGQGWADPEGAPAPTGEARAPLAAPDPFVVGFNREFASILHIFATDEVAAAERGPDVQSGQIATASGEALTAAQLDPLFTANQKVLLAGFFGDHRIPDRLFNGDEVGHTTAQQRILMAGHMLTVGEYTPGSFPQAVHARMCGHWVNLVQHYAGVGDAGGAGLREQFDHSGGLSLGVATDEDGDVGRAARETVFHGDRIREYEHPEDAPVRSQFQMEGLPFDQYQSVEAGDWLWIYNDNGGGGGNHSVVFSRWASPEQHNAEGVRYRRAICMSQLSPREGGREHTALLGERFVQNEEGHRITPVTHVSRVSADAHPVTTVDELVATLGSGSEAAENHLFLERLQERRGGHVDMGALLDDVRARNRVLIAELDAGGHLTPGQLQTFQGANAGTSDEDLGTLIRLNERLHVFAENAGSLDEGDEAQTAAREATHATAEAAHGPEREQLESDLQTADEHLEQLDHEHDEAERNAGLLDVGPELAAARRERRQLRDERRALRDRRRAAQTDEDRAAVEADGTRIGERLGVVEAEASRLADVEHAGHTELRGLHRAVRQLAGQIRREQAHRLRIEGELRALGGTSGYFTAHAGDRDHFQGRGEERRTTGLIRNLHPEPNWGAILRPDEGT